MAGPASPLRSIEASENIVHRAGTTYLWDWKIHWERVEGHIWHKISKTIKEREEVAVTGDHDNKAQRNNQESSNKKCCTFQVATHNELSWYLHLIIFNKSGIFNSLIINLLDVNLYFNQLLFDITWNNLYKYK